jgi:hypothetical protein
MRFVVKEDVAANPLNIGLFSPVGIVLYSEVLNPNIKLHILPDKGIREEIIAPVNQGAAPTEF